MYSSTRVALKYERVATIGSPLMKTLDWSVETLGREQ